MVNLLIVESPGKIKSLKKILGSNWQILATWGHFRVLANDGEDNLGFDLERDFVKCRFNIKDARAKKTIATIKRYAKTAERIFIATDDDREGEVIAWHLYEILRQRKKDLVRVVYQEITAEAVKMAIANPRSLNRGRVEAGLARSCLDKLVGFRGSPLVWHLSAKSVGRVQSASLHIICQREREINSFIPQDYWVNETEYKEGFRAKYQPGDEESTHVSSEDEAQDLLIITRSYNHRVRDLERKTVQKKPPAPFITSSLQQAAGNKLDFSPAKTMKLAQTLYENGLITYMRTDSVVLSTEFCESAKIWLENHDPKNIPASPNTLSSKSKSKGAQEAHEAIRPSDLTHPSSQLQQNLKEDEFKLYTLIWKRAIASQCKSALIEQTIVTVESGSILHKAKGQVISFLGYAKYWNNLEGDRFLPSLSIGQILNPLKIESTKKCTSPPSRYSEPQLVAQLEKLRIGRPSTYSSLIETIKQRFYVQLTKKKLMPTEIGMSVDSFIEEHIDRLVDVRFTAEMESHLDAIENGQQDWQQYLTNWNNTYFASAIDRAKNKIPITQTLKRSSNKTVPVKANCPVCQESLERYYYLKNKKQKSLLRCSDPTARSKTNHQQVVFFLTKNGDWWSPEHGEIKISKS